MEVKKELNTPLIVFLAIAFAFVVFQLLSFGYTIGDENNYYYMAKVTAQGMLPYKDFFFAHPPLHLFPLTIFSFFGIYAMKFTAILFTIATGYLIFLILFDKGKKEAIIGSLLFFTSHEILLHGANPVGQDITTFLFVLGLYFYLKKSYLYAGIGLGLACLSGLYALIPTAVIFIYELLKKDKSHFIDTLKGFLISFGIVNLVLALLLGKKYLIPVYWFQLIRPGAGSNFTVLSTFITFNLILIVGFILYFFYKEKKKSIIAMIIVYLIYLTLSNSIFLHYFFLLIPLLVIASACSITALINKKKESSWPMFLFIGIVIIALAFSAVNVYNTNNTIKFSSAKDIAAEIGQNKVVFGTDASLIAVLTNSKIPDKYIDANLQIFKSGLANVTDVINVLRTEHAYVITGDIESNGIRQKRGLLFYKEYDDFLNNECKKIDKNFDNYHWVYKC